MQKSGIESYGIEAHPFVYKIALVKTTWDTDIASLIDLSNHLLFELEMGIHLSAKTDISQLPELVRKCFSQENPQKLIYIRDSIHQKLSQDSSAFFEVALVCALRKAPAAATGWPYIVPKKRIREKVGLECFRKQIFEIIDDFKTIDSKYRKTPCHIILGDARESHLPDGLADLAFTSPPYLNNYDYADRTRLETYFNGYASSLGDITEKVRSRLIISATTQVNRTEYVVNDIVSEELKSAEPRVAKLIQLRVYELAKKRLEKDGKKVMTSSSGNILTI